MQPCTPGGDNSVETEPSDSTEIIPPLSNAALETSDVSEEKQDAAVSAEVKSEDRNDSGFESPLKGMEGSGSSMEKSDQDVSSESCDILGQFTDEELKSLVVMSKDQKPMLFCDMGRYVRQCRRKRFIFIN